MTNKEFIERLKINDLIYETDEDGNVVITKTTGEIFKSHFKQLEKDLEVLEILKSYIILTDNFRYIRSEKRVNKEDCEKIMRWLNGKD